MAVQAWVRPSRAEQPRAVRTLLPGERSLFSTAGTPLHNPREGHVSCLIFKAGIWTQDQALPTTPHCPFLMTLGDGKRKMMEYSSIIVGIYLDWPVASSQPHGEEKECSSFANWTTMRSPGIRSLTLHTSCLCSRNHARYLLLSTPHPSIHHWPPGIEEKLFQRS